MGVYIPNMKMPKSCAECELWSNCFYPKAPKEIDNKVMPDCPLIEIGDIEYQAYKEFRTMLLQKIEDHILYGERRNDGDI